MKAKDFQKKEKKTHLESRGNFPDFSVNCNDQSVIPAPHKALITVMPFPETSAWIFSAFRAEDKT